MAKGANVALTKEIPGLTGVIVGVSFDAGAERALGDNLAMLTVLCGADKRALSDDHVVHFNQMVSADLSTAALEQTRGDDAEQVEVDLAAVPPEIERIVFILYVGEGSGGRRTLGQLRRCTLRLLNLADGAAITSTVDLSQGLNNETAVSLGELYRHQGDWKFRVLGAGYSSGLAGVARDFGITL
ncbi:TerD family protein [Metallococcus carri]|nr:TerD family protein [Metallococcus carri]